MKSELPYTFLNNDMDNCIYVNKPCPFQPTRCLFYNNVSAFHHIKLVQYVLSQYNGEFRGQISIGLNCQNVDDYSDMYCGRSGENCADFVIRCVREIYGINFTGTILDADFTGSNINKLKVIRNVNDLRQLQRGSLLFTIDTVLNHFPDIANEVTPTDIRDIFRQGNQGNQENKMFSHVFFYLGILQPSGQMYIGGRNHASIMHSGVAKFDDMFNLTNSVLTYKQPRNQGSRYLLLAATLL